MRLLSTIVIALLGTVDHLRNQFSMSYSVTTQLIRHDLPGRTAMVSYQAVEEALSCSTITSGLEEYINDFYILIDSAP